LQRSGEAGQPRPPPVKRLLKGVATTSVEGGGIPRWGPLPRRLGIQRRDQLEAAVGPGGPANVHPAARADRVNPGPPLEVPAPGLMADDRTRGRFLQGIAVSERLSDGRHPGIVRTLNYVVFDDPFTGQELYGLVMELVEGESLASCLGRRLTEEHVLSLD